MSYHTDIYWCVVHFYHNCQKYRGSKNRAKILPLLSHSNNSYSDFSISVTTKIIETTGYKSESRNNLDCFLDQLLTKKLSSRINNFFKWICWHLRDVGDKKSHLPRKRCCVGNQYPTRAKVLATNWQFFILRIHSNNCSLSNYVITFSWHKITSLLKYYKKYFSNTNGSYSRATSYF